MLLLESNSKLMHTDQNAITVLQCQNFGCCLFTISSKQLENHYNLAFISIFAL